MWIVYILRCKNNFLYTGVTNKLERRILQHNTGKGAKFTLKNKPCTEMWHEHHLNRSSAQKRESEIKRWRKEEKIQLTKEFKHPCDKCA